MTFRHVTQHQHDLGHIAQSVAWTATLLLAVWVGGPAPIATAQTPPSEDAKNEAGDSAAAQSDQSSADKASESDSQSREPEEKSSQAEKKPDAKEKPSDKSDKSGKAAKQEGKSDDASRAEDAKQKGQAKRGEAEQDRRRLSMIDIKHLSAADIRGILQLHGLPVRGSLETVGPYKIAYDHNSNTLFVRASRAKTEQLKKIIKRFDVPSGKLESRIELDGGKIIRPLPNQLAQEAETVLNKLDYSISTPQVAGQKVLMYTPKNDDEKREIEQVIERLAAANGSDKQTR